MTGKDRAGALGRVPGAIGTAESDAPANARTGSQRGQAAASARVYWIDWLRVLGVLLLIPFHAARPFRTDGTWYIVSTWTSPVVSVILDAISQWHMPLLFVLAGASSGLAIHRRGVKGYLSARVGRLLVPLVFGLLVLVPPQTWVGARSNAAYTGSFSEYLASGRFLEPSPLGGAGQLGGFGLAHLWFIFVLAVVSVLAVPWMLYGQQTSFSGLGRTVAAPSGRWSLLLLPPMLLLVGQHAPRLAGYPVGYYLVVFCLGHALIRWPLVLAGAKEAASALCLVGLGIVVSTAVAGGQQGANLMARMTGEYIGQLGVWIFILGLVGLAQRHLNRPSRSLTYLAKASYPVYLLHQPIIVIAGGAILLLAVPPLVQGVLLLTVTFVLVFLLYEVVQRVKIGRYLFGIRS